MDYLSVKEASVLWQMDISKIGKLLRAGKIPGAAKIGDHWVIPKSTARPVDGRTRQAKETPREEFFRFPFYANFEADSFVPPLSGEERRLRQAQKDFLACRFDEAIPALDALVKSAESIYVKISAVFFRCIASVEHENGIAFLSCRSMLDSLLAESFPRKKEMSLFRPWLESYCIQYRAASRSLTVEASYDYSPSVVPLITLLSFFHLAEIEAGRTASVHFDIYEMACRQLERDGYNYEAQELHFLLFITYHLDDDRDAVLYHLRKGFDLAIQHELMVVPAAYASFYPALYAKVLPEYPAEFAEKINRFSAVIFKSLSVFTHKVSSTNILSVLSKNDYQYVFYASRGYSNKQIAGILKVSERTVSNKFSKIYETLGIKGKAELCRQLSDVIDIKQQTEGLSLTE